MVCPISYHISPITKTSPQQTTSRSRGGKRPLQISNELHSLITLLADDRNQSLEQIVTYAVTKQARLALNTPNVYRQQQYFHLIHATENEIKQRYYIERSRRSMQMRLINKSRRKESAQSASLS